MSPSTVLRRQIHFRFIFTTFSYSKRILHTQLLQFVIHFLVFSNFVSSFSRKFAYLTLECFFSGMLSHVVFQIAIPSTWVSAYFALMWPFSRVSHVVWFQCSSKRSRKITNFALERFLPSVNFAMLAKSRWMSKRRGTDIAGERFLPSMNSRMCPKKIFQKWWCDPVNMIIRSYRSTFYKRH